VLRIRDAGDARVRRHGAALLAGYRDGVLDRAAVEDGDVLLDVGAGDGLIGLAALDRVGSGGQVIFSDISADLLAECRRRVAAGRLLERCRFVQAAAEDLRAIADGSVDVVTTRSVLIYFDERDLLRWARAAALPHWSWTTGPRSRYRSRCRPPTGRC
jgi:SAM-dependent methyltransferase